MKKILVVSFAAFALLFLISPQAKADTPPICIDSATGTTDVQSFIAREPDAHVTGLVPCGQTTDPDTHQLECPCEIRHLFVMLAAIYSFIVWDISIPLAGLIIVIGGVMLVASAGNPGLASNAKRIMFGAIIGLALILGSWLIIDVVLKALGYTQSWYLLPF